MATLTDSGRIAAVEIVERRSRAAKIESTIRESDKDYPLLKM
jgi:hypothetical protein